MAYSDAHFRSHGLALATALAAVCALALPALAHARTAAELLTDRPLAPTDHALFRDSIYPDAPPLVPAPGTEPSEAEVTSMLDAYLVAEFPGDAASQNAAKAVFNDDTAEQKVPSASLRAALAALSGTFAEPAIGDILNDTTSDGNPRVASVEFGPSPFPTAIAFVDAGPLPDPEDTKIVFNERYQAENPFLFSWSMAHEPLHHEPPGPGSNSGYEEAVNGALDSLIYLHQLARHPGLATLGTELARRSNGFALARLNSGTGATLGLYQTNGNRKLFPDSPTRAETSWWQVFDNGDTTITPGNTLLGNYLANTHVPGAPICSSAEFSKTLLDCIDQNGNSRLSADELVAAARALKLDLDTDGDRVYDSADACPDTPAATANGCPEPSGGGAPVDGGSGDSGSSGGSSSPADQGSPAAGPTAAQIAAALGLDVRAVAKALARLRVRKLLRAGSFSVTGLNALTAGRFTLELAGRPAGRSTAAAKRVTIAKGSRTVRAAGRYTLKLKLTTKGKRTLRRARRVKGTLTLRFTPTGGASAKRSAKVNLKR